jgi:hypothetical protein
VLATYPYTTLAVGSLLYLALIPVAAYQYRRALARDTAITPPALGHAPTTTPTPPADEPPPRHLHS